MHAPRCREVILGLTSSKPGPRAREMSSASPILHASSLPSRDAKGWASTRWSSVLSIVGDGTVLSASVVGATEAFHILCAAAIPPALGRLGRCIGPVNCGCFGPVNSGCGRLSGLSMPDEGGCGPLIALVTSTVFNLDTAFWNLPRAVAAGPPDFVCSAAIPVTALHLVAGSVLPASRLI